MIAGWAEPAEPAEPDPAIREELARIERVILQGAVYVLEEFGGLQAALKRSIELEYQARRQEAGHASIHCGAAWRTARLNGVRFR